LRNPTDESGAYTLTFFRSAAIPLSFWSATTSWDLDIWVFFAGESASLGVDLAGSGSSRVCIVMEGGDDVCFEGLLLGIV
jgi:hypothetical protein